MSSGVRCPVGQTGLRRPRNRDAQIRGLLVFSSDVNRRHSQPFM